VDRVLSGQITLSAYSAGEFGAVASWAETAFAATLDSSPRAVEVVLRPVPGAMPAGLLEKRLRFEQSGDLTVSYRWDPAAFPSDTFFCPELSLARKVDVDLTPRAEVWWFPVATVSQSERGFEETVQGYSGTPRWSIQAAEARLTLRVRGV